MQWGVFVNPQYKVGSHFDIKIYLGGNYKRTADEFHNNYEPHGSLPWSKISRYSGRQFELQGVVTHGGDTLAFTAKCILA